MNLIKNVIGFDQPTVLLYPIAWYVNTLDGLYKKDHKIDPTAPHKVANSMLDKLAKGKSLWDVESFV